MLTLKDGDNVLLRSDSIQINVNAEMRQRVDQLLGPGNFKLLTSAPPVAAAPQRRDRAPVGV